MSTFYCGSATSTYPDTGEQLIDFKLALEEVTETASDITLSWTAGPTQLDKIGYWCTRALVPAAPAWPTGDYVVEVNVTDGDVEVNGKVRLHRIRQSDGAFLESSAYGASFGCRVVGVKTTTFAAEAWTAGSLTDRMAVEALFTNTGTSARTITIGLGTTNEEVTTPILVGFVVRPTPTALPLASVAPTRDSALSLAPSPVGTAASPVALALALALSLAPGATAAQLAAQEPTLDPGALSLALEAVAATLGSEAPTLDMALSLAPDALAAALAATDPALDLSLSLTPEAVSTDLAAVDPSLGMALNVAPQPAAASVEPAGPTLDMDLTLAPDALAAALTAEAPSVDLALSVSPDPTSAALSPVEPTAEMALTLSPETASVVLAAQGVTLDLILALAVDAVSASLSAQAVTLDLGVVEEVAGCLESIIKAVRDRYHTQVEIVEGVATLHDNEPPEDMDGQDAWVRLSITAEPSEQTTLGGVPGTRYHGTASARVFLRLGIGDSDALLLADAINEAFRGVTASGVIYSPPPFPILRARSGERWEIEVAIPFYADCAEAAS